MIDDDDPKGRRLTRVGRAVTLGDVDDQIPPPLRYLADAVTSRRRALGLTREGLRLAGGPSDSTMARIEKPDAQTAFPRPTTLERLDVALQWRAGSAAKCLDLRDPVPRQQVSEPAETRVVGTGAGIVVSGDRDPMDFDSVAVSVSVLREGLALIQSLAGKDMGEPEVNRGLVRFAHQLGAAHATEVLERFAASGRSVPGFLQTALSPHLAADVVSELATPQVRDDQCYRRWLAGLQGDDDGRFAERLDRRRRALELFAN